MQKCVIKLNSVMGFFYSLQMHDKRRKNEYSHGRVGHFYM